MLFGHPRYLHLWRSSWLALRAPAGGERGASLVELAFIIPLALLFIAGIVDFGWQINSRKAISSAVKYGARIGAAHSRRTSAGIPCGPVLSNICTGPSSPVSTGTGTPVTVAAAQAACNYLRDTRNVSAEQWTVRTEVIGGLAEPPGNPRSFQAIEVRVERTGGCLICFGGWFKNFVGGSTARFLLEGTCN